MGKTDRKKLRDEIRSHVRWVPEISERKGRKMVDALAIRQQTAMERKSVLDLDDCAKQYAELRKLYVRTPRGYLRRLVAA